MKLTPAQKDKFVDAAKDAASSLIRAHHKGVIGHQELADKLIEYGTQISNMLKENSIAVGEPTYQAAFDLHTADIIAGKRGHYTLAEFAARSLKDDTIRQILREEYGAR